MTPETHPMVSGMGVVANGLTRRLLAVVYISVLRPPLTQAEQWQVRPIVLYSVVAVGVLAVSTAAVLIRLADAPALAIAAYRLSLASLVTAPLSPCFERPPGPALPEHVPIPLVHGLRAGPRHHFAAWIASLEHTVGGKLGCAGDHQFPKKSADSRLSPTWLRRERLTNPAVAGGIALGVAGGMLVLGPGRPRCGQRGALRRLPGVNRSSCCGDVLPDWPPGKAKCLQRQLHWLLVYLGSAVALMAAVIFTGTPLTGFSAGTYWMILLVTLVPQLIGGALIAQLGPGAPERNSLVAVSAVMAEPVGATILAWLILIRLADAPALAIAAYRLSLAW